MIRPASEIEFPPSEALRNRASMLARMEELNRSCNSLMGVIAARLGAEALENNCEAEDLTCEQERLIENMRAMVRG